MTIHAFLVLNLYSRQMSSVKLEINGGQFPEFVEYSYYHLIECMTNGRDWTYDVLINQ